MSSLNQGADKKHQGYHSLNNLTFDIISQFCNNTQQDYGPSKLID